MAFMVMALALAWRSGHPVGTATVRLEVVPPPGTSPAKASRSEALESAANPGTGLARTISTGDQISQVLVKLREWDDNDDARLRPQRLQELDEMLAGTNALDMVQGLPPELLGYAFASPSLRQRLLSDPAAALDWMRDHTNVFNTQALTFVHDWKQTDEEGLQRYLAGLPEGEDRQKIIAVAGEEALSRDPTEVIQWARELGSGATQTRLLQMATSDWAGREPEAALSWMSEISDATLREQLAGSFAAGYARIDPGEAADWLVQSVPPGPTLDQAVEQVAWTWAMAQPAAVGDWVENFPAGDARQKVLTDLVNVWAQRDPGSLESWIAGLPDDSLRAETVELYSKRR